MTQPPKATSASSSKRNVPRSRSFVGSSSIRTLPPRFRILASSTRLRSPPISAQRDALLAERDVFSAAADFFPNRFLIVEEESVLIDVIDLGPRADLHCTARGGQFLQNDFEERRLAESVATDNTEAFPGCEIEVHVLKECAAAQLHTHVAQFNDAIRELRRRGDN